MHRIAIVIGAVLLAGGATAASAAVWVRRGLEEIAQQSVPMCLTLRHREQLAAGTFPNYQQDRIVAEILMLRDAPLPRRPGWQFREIGIHAIYVTFWPADSRRTVFVQLAARMPACHHGAGLA